MILFEFPLLIYRSTFLLPPKGLKRLVYETKRGREMNSWMYIAVIRLTMSVAYTIMRFHSWEG